MASIYPNFKNGKLISFKFKTCVGRDENEKQVFRCTTWKPNRQTTEDKMSAKAEKEAILWEQKVREEYLEAKSEVVPIDITFEDFVSKHWLPIQKKEARPTTFEFRTFLLKVILPYFGKRPLAEITSSDIGQYLKYLKSTYRTSRGKIVSAQTAKHHYSTLNLIFSQAKRQSYIAENPVSKVESPKLVRHKVDALSKREVAQFMMEVEKLPIKQQLMYSLLLTTGIRRGECFGLKWKDIDTSIELIQIERNVTYTTKSGAIEGLPKTDTSIRQIPLTNKVLKLLEEYRKTEHPISEESFLFHSAKSQYLPQDPSYLTKHMKRLMRRLNLPDMSPHDLRHTCASMLLQSGADIKSVQDILGHADASTTLNFYVQSNIESMRGAANRAFDF